MHLVVPAERGERSVASLQLVAATGPFMQYKNAIPALSVNIGAIISSSENVFRACGLSATATKRRSVKQLNVSWNTTGHLLENVVGDQAGE